MRLSGRVFGLRDLIRRIFVSEESAGTIQFEGSISCTMCSYCMPCPYGVDIPVVLTFSDSIVGKNELNWREVLGNYESKIPYLRGANHCIGCGACASQCPQSINIPEEMRRIDEFMESLKVKELSS